MRTRDLMAAQLWLVRLMHENQFGRIENLRIERGLPVPDSTVRVVRVARLGGGDGGQAQPRGADFEVKRAVAELFDALGRIEDGARVKIDFRWGLPCLLETEVAAL
jgi:hypothetical protein